MRHMPNALAMIPVSIPDPAFLKRKVSLAKDTGDEYRVHVTPLNSSNTSKGSKDVKYWVMEWN